MFPTEPDADPLGDWLALDRQDQARGARRRAGAAAPTTSRSAACTRASTAWRRGSERALERLRETLREPRAHGGRVRRAVRPPDRLGPQLLDLATGESQANINHLLQLGEAVVDRVDDGVAWYRLTSA